MEIKMTVTNFILAIILYTIFTLSVGTVIGLVFNNKVSINHYHAENTIESVMPRNAKRVIK